VSLFQVQPVRAKLLRCHAAACELRQLARRFTVTYSDTTADIYLSSKSAMAILQVRFFFLVCFEHCFVQANRGFGWGKKIPCGAMANYPHRGTDALTLPSITVLKAKGDASRLRTRVADGYSGINGLATLCADVVKEFQTL